jgi:hypothetical protein
MSFTFTEKNAGAGGSDRVWHPRRIVLDRETGKARATVIDTHEFGEVFFLDGVIQSAQSEADKYHTLLVKPALKMRERMGRLLGLDAPGSEGAEWNVLVLGGGEGITAQKALDWSQVWNVTQVDYDGELLRIFDKELPQWSRGVYQSGRVQLLVADAWDALYEMREFRTRRDAIIIDLTEPAEFGFAKWRDLLDMSIKQLAPYGSLVCYASTLATDNKGLPYLSDSDWGTWRVFANALEENNMTRHWKPFMYAVPMECFGGYSLFFIAADAQMADWMALADPDNDFHWEEAKEAGKYLMNT